MNEMVHFEIFFTFTQKGLDDPYMKLLDPMYPIFGVLGYPMIWHFVTRKYYLFSIFPYNFLYRAPYNS